MSCFVAFGITASSGRSREKLSITHNHPKKTAQLGTPRSWKQQAGQGTDWPADKQPHTSLLQHGSSYSDLINVP